MPSSKHEMFRAVGPTLLGSGSSVSFRLNPLGVLGSSVPLEQAIKDLTNWDRNGPKPSLELTLQLLRSVEKLKSISREQIKDSLVESDAEDLHAEFGLVFEFFEKAPAIEHVLRLNLFDKLGVLVRAFTNTVDPCEIKVMEVPQEPLQGNSVDALKWLFHWGDAESNERVAYYLQEYKDLPDANSMTSNRSLALKNLLDVIRAMPPCTIFPVPVLLANDDTKLSSILAVGLIALCSSIRYLISAVITMTVCVDSEVQSLDKTNVLKLLKEKSKKTFFSADQFKALAEYERRNANFDKLFLSPPLSDNALDQVRDCVITPASAKIWAGNAKRIVDRSRDVMVGGLQSFLKRIKEQMDVICPAFSFIKGGTFDHGEAQHFCARDHAANVHPAILAVHAILTEVAAMNTYFGVEKMVSHPILGQDIKAVHGCFIGAKVTLGVQSILGVLLDAAHDADAATKAISSAQKVKLSQTETVWDRIPKALQEAITHA